MLSKAEGTPGRAISMSPEIWNIWKQKLLPAPLLENSENKRLSGADQHKHKEKEPTWDVSFSGIRLFTRLDSLAAPTQQGGQLEWWAPAWGTVWKLLEGREEGSLQMVPHRVRGHQTTIALFPRECMQTAIRWGDRRMVIAPSTEYVSLPLQSLIPCSCTRGGEKESCTELGAVDSFEPGVRLRCSV
jgi:hypothetical protein